MLSSAIHFPVHQLLYKNLARYCNNFVYNLANFMRYAPDGNDYYGQGAKYLLENNEYFG